MTGSPPTGRRGGPSPARAVGRRLGDRPGRGAPTIARPILVLGGTGKTGRRVAERLRTLGLPVRIGSRSGDPPFDWDLPHTWPNVVWGARAAYVTFQPDLAVPGAVEAVREFAALARENDVRRIVLLSGRGEEGAENVEQAVRESGAEWTILRSAWFHQNFSEGYLVDAVREGDVALPVAYAGEPFVDADDVAEVAVAALTEDGHAGRLYELTGPRLLTFADAVEEIAEATGRDVRFRPVSSLAYAAELEAAGVAPAFISLVTYLFREVMDGRNAWLADGVQRALGRAPRDFRDYVRRTAMAGVWGPSAAAPGETVGVTEPTAVETPVG